MKFGVGLWGLQSPWLTPGLSGTRFRELVSDALHAEEAGFDGFWFSEHRLWYDGYNPVPLMAAAQVAANTLKIRVGTAVLLLPQHDPLRLAASAALVDQLSLGRLDLGIGIGSRELEFDAVGVPMTERGKRIDEALDLLPYLWKESEARAPSRSLFHWPTAPQSQTPLQQPLPLWIGAMSDVPIRRAARRGLNVIMPGSWAPARMKEATQLYKETAEVAGVDWKAVQFAMVRYLWTDRSREAARGYFPPRLRAFLQHQNHGMSAPQRAKTPLDGFEAIDADATVGSPPDLVEALKRYEEAGVNYLIARMHVPYVEREATLSAMTILAEDVVPEFRQTTS